MSRVTLTILTLAATAAAAHAQRSSPTETDPPAQARGAGLLAQLNNRVAEVDFENAPFDQAIDWISSLTSTNVVVRWKSLEYAGVERDEPVSLAARNIPLSQVLWLLLAEAGGPDVNLAYRAQGNLLIVSTEEELGREMMVRVYDVADLTSRVPEFRGAPHISLEHSGSGALMEGSPGGANEGSDEKGEGFRDAHAERLADVIQGAIDPDSWSSNGGAGTIQVYRNILIVRNSVYVHEAIGGYVDTDR